MVEVRVSVVGLGLKVEGWFFLLFTSCGREHALLILPRVALISLLRSHRNAIHRFLPNKASRHRSMWFQGRTSWLGVSGFRCYKDFAGWLLYSPKPPDSLELVMPGWGNAAATTRVILLLFISPRTARTLQKKYHPTETHGKPDYTVKRP